jgi:hypothetical protein
MSTPSIKTALQAFLARLKPCPEPGNGVHQWFYHAACCAVAAGLPDEEAIVEIEALATRDPNGSVDKRTGRQSSAVTAVVSSEFDRNSKDHPKRVHRSGPDLKIAQTN